MRKAVYLIICLSISQIVFSQSETKSKYSFRDSQDSLLLKRVWTNLRNAIQDNDQTGLSKLIEFPIDFTPWFGDTILNLNTSDDIKVTEKAFFQSQHKMFFNEQIKNCILKQTNFSRNITVPTYDYDGNVSGWLFLYTILKPSQNSEGIQGTFFINKKRGDFKITGVGVIP